MNFFAHQAQARRQTRRMLVMFALAVVMIVAAVDVVLLTVFDRDGQGIGSGGLALASAAVLLVIVLGSMYRIATLRGGGAAVARQLGGTQVGGGARNFAHRRLYNVVEEISIAAGVPMPEVFVLEQEAGINAFASGYAPSDAAITVTRGALEKLTREELQGVIGHEFSHVLNGDMRLNIRLIGVVFGILVIATIGRKIAELAAHGRGKDAAAPALIGLALFLVGYIGVVLARLIKASVSRQREYLADASAVQFTRQTEGIAGALKKIAGLAEGSRLASSDKEEVAHMLFGDGVGYSALFATHPKIELRIKRLDPAFDPEELDRIAAAWTQPLRVNGDAREEAGVSIAGFAPAVPIERKREAPAPALPAADARLELSPDAVVEQVGNPDGNDRRAARALRDTIPASLREAAWQGGQAVPLVLALVLDADRAVRERQLELVAERHDAGTRDLVAALAIELDGLHPMQRLPLAALAFPALRRRPRVDVHAAAASLDALIHADGRVGLDEYCLAMLVRLQVIESLDPARSTRIGRVKLPAVEAELRDLLAILARHGHRDEESARRAWMDGMREALPGATARYAPPERFVEALDRALPRLDLLAPAGKQLVVSAMTRAISADGEVAVAESELLRTVCAALHCPLPPILHGAA